MKTLQLLGMQMSGIDGHGKRHEIGLPKFFSSISKPNQTRSAKKHQLPADLSGEKSGGNRCLNQFSRCRSGTSTSSHLAICS